MTIIRSLLLSVAMFFTICLHSPAQENKLVFAPHWLPQAQFAGYYIALDQGYYAAAGIDVQIIHPSASVNALNFLTDGQADIISLFLITAVNAVNSGIDMVNVAQISQHSAIMFVSKKSSGIETLQDFEGKKIGVWMSGFEEVPKALLHDNNIKAEWIPILSTVNLFLLDGIDVMTVMWYNEYNQIYLSGINHDELNTFFMADYSFNLPEDGLYTLRQTAIDKNEEIKAFTEATLKGWDFAAKNIDYTIKLVVDMMQESNVPSNYAHQRWMLEKVVETHNIANKNVGRTELHRDDFEKAVSIIKEAYNSNIHIDFGNFFQPVIPQGQ